MSKVATKELTTIENHAVLTPMELLDRAMSSGAGVDVLEKIMALQERWEKNEARKAYVAAFSQFMAETIEELRTTVDVEALTAEMLRRAPFVDLVVGPQSYHRLGNLVARARSEGRGIVETLRHSRSPAVLMQNHGVFTVGKTARAAAWARRSRRPRSSTIISFSHR